jgi:hypothetical protein
MKPAKVPIKKPIKLLIYLDAIIGKLVAFRLRISLENPRQESVRKVLRLLVKESNQK